MKAQYNGKVLAEAPKEALIYIEGNWYFPPSSVHQEFLTKSDTPYTCPWKGKCQYFTVTDGNTTGQDMAWSYPEPLETGVALVGKDFANYVAFWKDVSISE